MAYTLLYDGQILFDPYGDDVVYDASLSAQINGSSHLDFSISKKNSLYDRLAEHDGLVTLYSEDIKLFEGEISKISEDMDGNREIECVSVLSYLNDTLVRPYSTNPSGEETPIKLLEAPSTIDGLFQWYIDEHNKNVKSPAKNFSVGVNQGMMLTTAAHIYASSTVLPTTADEISEKILDRYGGYLTLTYEPDLYVLNLYADVHEANTQIIDFGVNLVDFDKTTDTADQYTAVRPTGGTPESEDPNVRYPPTTIESIADDQSFFDGDIVKHGDVIYSTAAVARYGYREYNWTDSEETDPQKLLEKSIKILNALISPHLTIEAKAVDLSLYMKNGYEHLEVGQAARIRSKPHGIDEYLMVSEIDLDLQDPGQTTYTLGVAYDTLTGQQSKFIRDLNSNINSAFDIVGNISQDVKDQAVEIQGVTDKIDDVNDKLLEFQTSTDAIIKDLQNQVDGAIETWFYEGVPTLANEPAVNWPGSVSRNAHLGDLYYDTKTGYAYRFACIDDIYQWLKITDVDVTEALKIANEAQDTADKKRRVFTTTPFVPYDDGDMWYRNGEIYISIATRGWNDTYSEADWKPADYATSEDLNEVSDKADSAVFSTVQEWYISTSPTELQDGSWSDSQPTWKEGKYIWCRDVITKVDGTVTYGTPYCATGNTGEPATYICIDPSAGTTFHRDDTETVLQVTVLHGSEMATTFAALQAMLPGSSLEWTRVEQNGSSSIVPSTDSRLSDSGMALTVLPSDVSSKAVFNVTLNVPD